jgi:exopolyphosphatase/pppGpp-phosphohydrolase
MEMTESTLLWRINPDGGHMNRKHLSRAAARLDGGRGGLIELGAQSLKIHRVEGGYLRTVKFPYDLGHEVYGTGEISVATVRRIVDVMRESRLDPAFAIGTSAVRDARNPRILRTALRRECAADVRVLTCYEEASLLARSYMSHSGKLPAMIMDVGGGSIETVYVTRNRSMVWDSLPLGAIRLYQRWKSDGLSSTGEWIDDTLAKASVVMADEVYLTGGTAKAIARTLGTTEVARRDLEALERRVHRDGPPNTLKPDRARVFLAGLLAVRKLIEFVRARKLTYMSLSVGRQALEECIGAIVSTAHLRSLASSGSHNGRRASRG